MANVSQIKLPNGTTYDIKDSVSGYITDAGVTGVKGNAESSYRTGQVNLTASDVGAAASSHAHGNITSGGDITATAPTIASGDQIIINDNSASKITNGPTFDGSTTTTALTPKGTWETFSKFSGSYNDLSNKPTIPTKTSDLTNDSGFITSDNKVKQSPIGNSTLRKGVLLSYDSYSGLSNETTNTSYVSNRFLFCPGNSSGTVPILEVLDSSGNKSGRLSYNNVILQNSSNAYQTTVTAGTPTANNTVTLPSATGTVALTSDIPTVPTNISAFTNDAGYITSADVPEGASAYTGTISAVGTSASSGTNNGFARGDHTHNITKTTINSVLGTGSGTTKYYREDGTWVTPTDTKNTAGSTNTSSKIFLIGATSQAANPQTYSHDTAYVGTDGKLYSASKVVLVGGSNASSSVTISPTTTDVYSMTSAGSVTAGTKASFTRGTFSQGTLPTMTWTMDSTDTKKLNITFSQGTLPTHAADSFTANTPTAVTLPGRSSSAIKAWTGYSAATAAAQVFTGVTG